MHFHHGTPAAFNRQKGNLFILEKHHLITTTYFHDFSKEKFSFLTIHREKSVNWWNLLAHETRGSTYKSGIIFLSATTSSSNRNPRNPWTPCPGTESPDRRDLYSVKNEMRNVE